MAGSTLFGYTVEEDEGKIVITLTGAIAQSLLQRYSAEGVGQNPRLLSSLLPFGNLGSRTVFLRPRHAPERTLSQPAEPPDIKDIFGQGFDRSHSEFEAQLTEYRDLLGSGNAAAARAAAPQRASPRSVAPRAAKRAKRRK
jgi:hypothetical protein